MNTCTIVYQPPGGAKGRTIVQLPDGFVHSAGSAPQPVHGSYTRSSAEKAVTLWVGTHPVREPSRSCRAGFTTRRELPFHKEKVPSTATIFPKDSVSQQNRSSTRRDSTLHQSSSAHTSPKGGSHHHHHHHYHSANSRIVDDSHSSRSRHTIHHASSIKQSDAGVKHASHREKSKYPPPPYIPHQARGSEQVMVNVTRWAPMSIFGPVKKSSRGYRSIRPTDLFPVETATFIGSSSGVARAQRHMYKNGR